MQLKGAEKTAECRWRAGRANKSRVWKKERKKQNVRFCERERNREQTCLLPLKKEGRGVCLCVKDNRQRVEEEEVPPGGRVCGFMLFDST